MNFIPEPFKTGFDITNKKKRICTFMMKRPFDSTTIFHIRLNLKKGVGGDFMFGEGFYPTCSTMPYILNCTSDWVKVKLKYTLHITHYILYEESELFYQNVELIKLCTKFSVYFNCFAP
ncbi:hypothetical protein [Bacillus subtilis]|uniref:hypothetical protein n=1 Tax=Bacillus subtilis TaxID=1423 RepID=UPI0020C207CD|nr:hypothetical protein [Bacillus subtilis]MCP6733095.1 hypothetical protein [Bacillus subtilis]